MPLIFSRDEIREFLSEMGYGDLTDDDLDRFVKDLRKLIKSESKQRRRRRLGHTGNTHSDFSTTDESNSVGREAEGVDATTSQSGLDTQPRLLFTPKSKLPKKKPKPRRVEESSEFTTSRDATSDSNPQSTTSNTNGQRTGDSFTRTSESSLSSVLQERNFIPGSETERRIPKVDRIRRSVVSAPQGRPFDERNLLPFGPDDGEQQLEKTRPRLRPATEDLKAVDENFGSSSSSEALSDTDLLCLMEHILKNDLVGAISGAGDNGESSKNKKIEIPMKIRRDPVALYHWYKTFWDKQKPPGEDRHMQLRWNVRAGTVGRYPCDMDGAPTNYLRQNPVRPKKKTVSAF